jgi:hypothetical protein
VDEDLLAERFEANRPRLRTVAYRMLGSRAEVVARFFAGGARPAEIDAAPGAVVMAGGRTRIAIAFTVAGGRIVGIDVVADPTELAHLDVAVAGDRPAAEDTATP